MTRPDAHETDTQARRFVPATLPAAWEHRETTGRDYGIDMEVEVFEGGLATGGVLLLQIKGTHSINTDSAGDVIVDFPVRTLIYADLFAAPVVLALCPVDAARPQFYFLWLQEYIHVVLNYEHPNWMQNRETVRLFIPSENQMPGQEERLASIARLPRAAMEMLQLTRIIHELQYAAEPLTYIVDNEIDVSTLDATERLLREAAGLQNLLNAELAGGDYLAEDINAALELIQKVRATLSVSPEGRRDISIAGNQISMKIHSLSAGTTHPHDYHLLHTLWTVERDHRF